MKGVIFMTSKEQLTETTIKFLIEKSNNTELQNEVISKLEKDITDKILNEIKNKYDHIEKLRLYVNKDSVEIYIRLEQGLIKEGLEDEILKEIKDPISSILENYRNNQLYINSNIDITRIRVQVEGFNERNIFMYYFSDEYLPSLKDKPLNVTDNTLNQLADIFYKSDLDNIEKVLRNCDNFTEFTRECEYVSRYYGDGAVAFYHPWVEENLNAEGYTKQRRLTVYKKLWYTYQSGKWDELKELANN